RATAGASWRRMSRWQWLSATGIGSGSGAGGRSARRWSVMPGPGPGPRRCAGATSYPCLVDEPQARPLLVDHGRVELGEDRRRPGDRRTHGDGPVLPPGGAGVLAGDDGVVAHRGVVEVADLADLGHGLED